MLALLVLALMAASPVTDSTSSAELAVYLRAPDPLLAYARARLDPYRTGWQPGVRVPLRTRKGIAGLVGYTTPPTASEAARGSVWFLVTPSHEVFLVRNLGSHRAVFSAKVGRFPAVLLGAYSQHQGYGTATSTWVYHDGSTYRFREQVIDSDPDDRTQGETTTRGKLELEHLPRELAEGIDPRTFQPLSPTIGREYESSSTDQR